MHVVSRDGVWQAVCRYYDGDKRVRVRRSTGVRDDGTAKSRHTAEINAAEIERALALGRNRRVRTETIKQAFEKLIVHKQLAGRSPETIEITLEKAKNVFEYFGPDRPAESVTAQDLKDYAVKRAERAAASSTIAREILELRAAIKAVGLVAPKGPLLAPERARDRWLPPVEFQRLLENIRPERQDHVLMYRLCGLSRSELYKIDPDKGDLDFENSAFRVRGSKAKGRDRWLPMRPEVRAILEHRQDRRPMFESWGNCYRELKMAAARAGIARFNLNDLRRSFATELALAGASSLQVKPLMGHSPNSRVLDKHYARLQGRQLHNVTDALASYRVTCVSDSVDPVDSVDVPKAAGGTK